MSNNSIYFNESGKIIGKAITTIHYTGETYGGGIVFYTWSGGTCGLIYQPQLLGKDYWGCDYGNVIPTVATGYDIGTGRENTLSIINNCSYFPAAALCTGSTYSGYTDWYLPSKWELFQIFQAKSYLPNLLNEDYWSSTECTSEYAHHMYMANGNHHGCEPGYLYPDNFKDVSHNVRAIRQF